MFDHKRISDPVHGSIGLSALEVQLINTAVFQRLRNVKQLGLAHYVFPGADYSRFAHSVGVCHITGQILDSLRTIYRKKLGLKDIQTYRIAALLHDVGHYPYSHAAEEAILNHYAGTYLKSKPGVAVTRTKRSFKHDRVSKEILLLDKEIRDVLLTAKIAPESISSIFLRERPPRFANLVSSDLDADRIDYLLRTAHHTGLPYGAVDMDYILSQMRLDKNNRVCLSEKALRTADHFLLCRYFDYQQVTFHKTVVAFELILKDVISSLLMSGMIDCSAESISEMIRDGRWCHFDDAHILGKIKDLYNCSTDNPVIRAKAKAILDRQPPKLLVEEEAIMSRLDRSEDFLRKKQDLNRKIRGWGRKFKIKQDLWYVWDRSMYLTKAGPYVPVSAIEETASDDIEKLQQAIRILNQDNKTSCPIMDVKYSLMSVLSNQVANTIRVYVLLPSGHEDKRLKIRKQIKRELSTYNWK